MMPPSDMAAAFDAIDVVIKMTAMHISEDVAFQTAQFIMDAMLQLRSISQHQHVQDQATFDAAAFEEAQFIKDMDRLTQVFVSYDLENLYCVSQALEAQLSCHDLPRLSARFSKIIQLWLTENLNMEAKNEKQKQKQAAAQAAAASAFASRAVGYAHPGSSTGQKVHKAKYLDAQETGCGTTVEGKGKGKMPVISTFSSDSKPNTRTDLTESFASSSFLDKHQRVASRTRADSGPRAESSTRQDGEQPNDSNDWGVDKADGVLIGRPPEYPPGLLDWEDKDKGRKVADVAPDNLTRAKTAAVSTLRAAQGALHGLIKGGGSGSGSNPKEGTQEQRKKEKKKKQKKGGKKGKFVKTGKEQESREHAHQYSDYYDSEDGSDWVTL